MNTTQANTTKQLPKSISINLPGVHWRKQATMLSAKALGYAGVININYHANSKAHIVAITDFTFNMTDGKQHPQSIGKIVKTIRLVTIDGVRQTITEYDTLYMPTTERLAFDTLQEAKEYFMHKIADILNATITKMEHHTDIHLRAYYKAPQ